jgi:hypothetical protein
MGKLINSALTIMGATTAALALVVGGAACSRSRSATTPSRSVQTPAPAAERVNPGSGYFGAAPENVNRPSTTPPTGMGGGPGSTMDQPSGGSSMGLEESGDAGPGTSGTGPGTEVDMTGDSEKGSGTTGGHHPK